jgi:hypothetical protein
VLKGSDTKNVAESRYKGANKDTTEQGAEETFRPKGEKLTR